MLKIFQGGSNNAKIKQKVREQVRLIEAEADEKLISIATAAAVEAFGTKSTHAEIACEVVKAVSEGRSGHWHCIVGRRFGSSITYEPRTYVYFYIGYLAVMLFKTTED